MRNQIISSDEFIRRVHQELSSQDSKGIENLDVENLIFHNSFESDKRIFQF